MTHLSLRRNSLRYPGYDYSQAGAYFLTINTHGNQQLFGTVTGPDVTLSIPGQQVRNSWLGLAERFPGIIIDEFIVMPDHLHGIIMLGTNPTIPHTGLTAGLLVNSFKNSVIAAWRTGVRDHGWPRYQGKLWHRDYYERIIRNDAEPGTIREYLLGNPARWSEKRGL